MKIEDLKNYKDIKRRLKREQELTWKVLQARFLAGEAAPETFEGWLDECKRRLSEDEYREYLELRVSPETRRGLRESEN